METILFLEWKSFGNDFIIKAFKEIGYEVKCIPFPRDKEDARMGTELTEKVLRAILEVRPAFVFSFNYFPVAAIACKAARVKYVSWVYDSPFILMYSQTIFYDTNRVFIFDSEEVRRLQELGAKNVYYLPMAAATQFYDTCEPDERSHKRFDSDVSFIGSMYSETHQHMFRHLENLDEYTKGYLYGLMEMQKNIYGMDILENALNNAPQIVSNMQKVCPVTAQGDGLETVEWTFANYFLARKVTAMERKEIMQTLSDQVTKDGKKWKIKLFTPEKTESLKGIQNEGKIDYYDDAPYAMKCAKINLNISLRSIHNGMPLRAMDILGCGGFLLTNYQSDFMDAFVPGEDFVYYENVKEIPKLVEYYLEHEEERKKIALNGYKKAKELFSYKKQLQTILDTI